MLSHNATDPVKVLEKLGFEVVRVKGSHQSITEFAAAL
ncbi:type II toxin-antitoxin system HicA family toxin [Protofrankia symbiont of Coriaria ruscifolia]